MRIARKGVCSADAVLQARANGHNVVVEFFLEHECCRDTYEKVAPLEYLAELDARKRAEQNARHYAAKEAAIREEEEAKSLARGRAESEPKCSVCLDLFTEPMTTSCNHTFCAQCLLSWLGKGWNTCPMCRSDLK
jgi:hypothetical protein